MSQLRLVTLSNPATYCLQLPHVTLPEGGFIGKRNIRVFWSVRVVFPMDIILEYFPEVGQPRFGQETYIPNKSANTSSSKCTTRKTYEEYLVSFDIVGCQEAVGFADIVLNTIACETTGDAHESAALGSDSGLVIDHLGLPLLICVIDGPAYASNVAGMLQHTCTEIKRVQPGSCFR